MNYQSDYHDTKTPLSAASTTATNSEYIDKLRQEAMRHLDAGSKVMPINLSNGKEPIGTGPWGETVLKANQTRDGIEAMLSKAVRIANRKDYTIGIAKPLQPGEFVIDIDGPVQLRSKIRDEFRKRVEAVCPGLFGKLSEQETINQGFHLGGTTDPEVATGNRKLAFYLDENGKKKVKIETREHRGYICISPSQGYTLKRHDFTVMNCISPDEFEALMRAALEMNDVPGEIKTAEKPKVTGDTPLNKINAASAPDDVIRLLEKHGATHVRTGRGTAYMRRPGKDQGHSGTVAEHAAFTCFSSNWPPFQAEKAYAPASVWTLLEHGGDFKKAVKSAARHQRHTPSTPEPPPVPNYTEMSPKTFPQDGGPIPVDKDSPPDPLDISGRFIDHGLPKLPAGCVPEIIFDFAQDASRRIGCNPEAPAMAAVTVCAGVLKDTYKVMAKQNDTLWLQRACLWTMLFGLPTARKTSAIKSAMAPVYSRDKENRSQFLDELSQYEQILEEYKASKKAQTTDQVDDGHAVERPEKPIEHRLFLDDSTLESMTDILAENPHGSLINPDEMAAWISNFDAYKSSKGGQRAIMLKAYDGGPTRVDRVGRGRMFVPNFSFCVIGGIQPDRFSDMLKKEKLVSDGFLQRLNPVYCERRKPVDVAAGPAVKSYNEMVLALIDMEARMDSRPHRIAPEGRKYLENLNDFVEAFLVQPDLHQGFASSIDRLPALYARLCMTYHAIHQAKKISTGKCGPGDKPPNVIPAETAKMAYRLITEFTIPTLIKFYRDEICADEDSTDAQWIGGYILAKECESITYRDITRSNKKRFNDKARINIAMEALAMANWLEPVKTDRKGFAITWDVNPKVHLKFKDAAEAERKRRNHERAKIFHATEKLRRGKYVI
jgi:Protein of unknown function (DUF3987)